jgi:endonuclease/exonuclease/phosphatase (EEP) superfamily protein YafD
VVHPPIPDVVWLDGAPLPRGIRAQPGESTVEEVAHAARTAEGMRIVAGDFNLPDSTAGYRTLASDLTDTYVAAGWGLGFTFPNNLSVRGVRLPGLVRIDYVFVSDEFSARSARVDCRGSSDHCYLVSELAVRTRD